MGTRMCAALAMGVLVVMLAGCEQASDKVAEDAPARIEAEPTKGKVASVFEAENFMGEKIDVLVFPKVESDDAVHLRARVSGIDPKTLSAKAYGFTVYEASRDSETGVAFLSKKDVYHLGSEDKVFIDSRFYYGDGFLAVDIADVSQKSWSCQKEATVSDLAKLLTIADAVKSGTGHREAYEAVHGPGAMAQNCYREDADHEKAGSWVLGPQKIEEGVFVDLSRMKGVGNRFTTKFIPSP